MATLIPVKGQSQPVNCPREDGFELEEVYKLLEAETVETLILKNGAMLIFNEEGRRLRLPFNGEATKIAGTLILGPALFCDGWEFQ